MGAHRHQRDGIVAAIIDNATLIERIGEGGGSRYPRPIGAARPRGTQQTLDQECRQAAEKIELTLAGRQSEWASAE